MTPSAHQHHRGGVTAALYFRVSTDDQSHDSQEREVRDFCARAGWTKLLEFRDTASGGAGSRRPGLESLMQAVRAGKVDKIVAYKLDRIGRSLTHLALILEELANNRVALICTSQSINTSDDNPIGRLQIGVLMAVAEFERAQIRERTIAGIKSARAKGVKLGRPKLSMEKQGAIIDAANRLGGKKVRQISRELGIACSIVSRTLKNVDLK